MQKQTLKHSAIGAFETVIMMPTVLEHFTPRKEDALRSFIFPLLLYPLALLSFSMRNHTHDPGALGLHALTVWGGMFFFYAIMFYVAEWRGKQAYFWQYMNMANAQCIASAVLLSPVFLMIFNRADDGPFFDQYWIFFIFANTVLGAFIIAKALRLNWYLGGFFAILNLYISDIGGRIVQAYLG